MKCPICKELELIPAIGPEDSPILLFGPFPGEEEIKKGEPWVGTTGGVLKWELMRVGIDFDKCRVTNLWLHEPIDKPPKTRPNPLYPLELDWHRSQLKQEARGKAGILAMGASTSKLFFGRSIDDITGCRVQSRHLPDANFIIACYNPAVVFHSVVGEVRLAIRRFAELAKGVL